jgi:hypothetical protein
MVDVQVTTLMTCLQRVWRTAIIESTHSQFPLSPTQLKSRATLPEQEISTKTRLFDVSIEMEVSAPIL